MDFAVSRALHRALQSRVSRLAVLVAFFLIPASAAFSLDGVVAKAEPTARIFYLAPAQAADPKLRPFTDEQWRAAGVTLLRSFSELRNAVTAPGDTVLVDGEVFGQVDTYWLRTQFAQRRVIGGVNVGMNELYRVLGDPRRQLYRDGKPIPQTPWIDLAAQRPHYALTASGPHCNRGSQDYFSTTPLATLLERIRLSAECAKA